MKKGGKFETSVNAATSDNMEYHRQCGVSLPANEALIEQIFTDRLCTTGTCRLKPTSDTDTPTTLVVKYDSECVL